MADFQREERYLVVKLSDFHTEQDEEAVRGWLRKFGVPTRQCVVVEHDWPIYEEVWDMVRRMAEGRSQKRDEMEAMLQDSQWATAQAEDRLQRANDLSDDFAGERARIKKELAAALDYDASNPSMCDLIAVVRLLKQERDAPFGRIAELEQAERMHIQLREKMQRERDALAAHVERIINEWSSGDDQFSDEWIDRMGSIIEDAPATSLARHDAFKQAEHLNDMADTAEQLGSPWTVDDLRKEAKDLHLKATGTTCPDEGCPHYGTPHAHPEPQEELWGSDPNCEHDIQDRPGGGIKCTKCNGWFCY